MTKEEAYNAMQEGLCVSHKDFAEDEFLYMNENFIIKDENGDDFEASWDVKTSDRWLTDWYIYKGKGAKKRKFLSFGKQEEETFKIAHIYGQPCPGKELCVQYSQVGETACLFCDTNDTDRFISSENDVIYSIEDNDGKMIEMKEDNILNENPPKRPSLLQRIKQFPTLH